MCLRAHGLTSPNQFPHLHNESSDSTSLVEWPEACRSRCTRSACVTQGVRMADSGLMVSSVGRSPALGRALSVGFHGPLDTCVPVDLLELSVWYLYSTTITVVWPLPSSFCDLCKPLSWPSEPHPQAVFLPDLWLFSSSPSVVPELFSIPPPPFLDSHPNSHRVDCIRGPQVPVFDGSSSHLTSLWLWALKPPPCSSQGPSYSVC